MIWIYFCSFHFFRCDNGYLQLSGDCEQVKQYCGDKSSGGSYVYLSCSNKLEISYRSGINQEDGYRGFNLYYEFTPNGKLLFK